MVTRRVRLGAGARVSLAGLLAPVWAELSSIKKRLPSVSPATVTSIDPVRIQVDGQTAPVAASPDSLVPVGPGDRVRVLRYGTTNLILGRVNTAGMPWRMTAGAGQIQGEGNTTASLTINFPPNLFTLPPAVTAIGNNSLYNIARDTPTTTSVTLTARNIAGDTFTGGVGVTWVAVQMTPLTAGV